MEPMRRLWSNMVLQDPRVSSMLLDMATRENRIIKNRRVMYQGLVLPSFRPIEHDDSVLARDFRRGVHFVIFRLLRSVLKSQCALPR